MIKAKSAFNVKQKTSPITPFGGSKTPRNLKPELSVKTFTSKKKLTYHSATNSGGAQKLENPKELGLKPLHSKGVSSPNISLNSSSSSNHPSEKTTPKANVASKKKTAFSKTGFTAK